MKRCVLALLALALCNLLFHGTAQAAPKQAASDAVRVAVLPFQINGGADLNYLNDELPKLFEQRLAQKGFKVIPAKDTLRLLKKQQISQLNLATARSIARQAGANYAVYGSFSKTGDAFSIDARMVDAAGQQGAQPYFAQKQNMIELLPAVDELVDKMGGGAVKGDAITDIQIRGVKVLDPDVVLMRLSTRKGDVVDPSTLNEEIKRIWDTRLLQRRERRHRTGRTGPRARVHGQGKAPHRRRNRQRFRRSQKKEDILAAMSSKTGSVLNDRLLAEDIQKVTELYRKEGFYLAEVNYRIEQKANSACAVLVFDVKEGKKLYIKEIKNRRAPGHRRRRSSRRNSRSKNTASCHGSPERACSAKNTLSATPPRSRPSSP